MEIYLNEQYLQIPDEVVAALLTLVREEVVGQFAKLGGAANTVGDMAAREVLRQLEGTYGRAIRPAKGVNRINHLLAFVLGQAGAALVGSAIVVEAAPDGSFTRKDWYSADELTALNSREPAVSGGADPYQTGVSLVTSGDNRGGENHLSTRYYPLTLPPGS